MFFQAYFRSKIGKKNNTLVNNKGYAEPFRLFKEKSDICKVKSTLIL